MGDDEGTKVGQESQIIDAKVDGVMHEFETSKVGRNIPLGIKEIDSRDLEFVALCAKAILFVPTVFLTCIGLRDFLYWFEILMRAVLVLDMIFAVTMFFLSIKVAFPVYVLSVSLKYIFITIYAIMTCCYNMSFQMVLFSALFLLVYGAVELVNLFYLRNTINKYGTEPAKEDAAGARV